MLSDGIIEAVDVLRDSLNRFIACLEYGSPDQFRLDRLEAGFDHGVVIAISLAAHRWKDVLRLEKLAVIVTGILASAVRMLNETWFGLPDCNGFLQSTDGEIPLHPVACIPSDDAA